VSTNEGPFVDRTSSVIQQVVCTRPVPPPIFCERFESHFFLDLSAVLGASTTNFRIRIEADDATPAPDTGTGFDEVVVQILDLI
jgi:hypothetical protein